MLYDKEGNFTKRENSLYNDALETEDFIEILKKNKDVILKYGDGFGETLSLGAVAEKIEFLREKLIESNSTKKAKKEPEKPKKYVFHFSDFIIEKLYEEVSEGFLEVRIYEGTLDNPVLVINEKTQFFSILLSGAYRTENFLYVIYQNYEEKPETEDRLKYMLKGD